MDDGWQPVKSGEHVVAALGLDGIGIPALERLLLAPDSSAYLRVEADDEPRESGVFAYGLPGTRWYFNVSACRSLKGDVVVALVAYLATHSIPVAAGAAALRKLSDSLRRLSADEVAVVRAIARVCPGNPYEHPVLEEAVRSAFRGDPDALDDLLDGLQAKGIVEGRRRDRIKLVF